MSKRLTVFKYFFDFLKDQENWLNRMAENGYRLIKCGIMTYTFEACERDEYEYAIEFVGNQSYAKAQDYRSYLESMGFRTFSKNINLNFSYGKVRWRPYGKGMGQLATSPGGFNKELLILEKRKDGRPFELHTDVSDKLNTYKTVGLGYAWAVLVMFGLVAMTFLSDVSSLSGPIIWILRAVILVLGILIMIPAVRYWRVVNSLKKDHKTYE